MENLTESGFYGFVPFVAVCSKTSGYFTSTTVDKVKLSRSCGPVSTVSFLSPAALSAWAKSMMRMLWLPKVLQWY